MRVLRLALVVALSIALTACNPFGGGSSNNITGPSTGFSASSSVSYSIVAGANLQANLPVSYLAPTGSTNLTATFTNGVWTSGAIGGYGQFISAKPSITAFISTGCATVEVLVDSTPAASVTGCNQQLTATLK